MDATILRRAVERASVLQPELAWLQSIRTSALERFVREGLPTIANEDWRYTDLAPVADLTERSLLNPASDSSVQWSPPRIAGAGNISAVFVDGMYRADLSGTPETRGVTVTRVGQAPSSMRSVLAERIGGSATGLTGLAALNTALLRDGLVIDIAEGIKVEQPIYVVFGSSTSGATFNRLLVRLGAGSQATVIEHHASLRESVSNTMTEIACGKNSSLHYVKLQAESASAMHVASQHVSIDAGASADVLHLDLGARLARNDLQLELSGEGAETSAHGLFFADGSRHLDNHTRIDHRAPGTRSRELYRGIADGRGRGIFNGKVIVHAGAMKADARLTSQNLLLSRTAELDTKPELEIYADDVKCSHGATTGQLDANSIFYLQSRGIPAAEARRILIASFAREIIGRLASPLDAHVLGVMRERLPEMAAIAESP